MSHHDHQEADLTVFHLTKSVAAAVDGVSDLVNVRAAVLTREEWTALKLQQMRLGNIINHATVREEVA